MKNLLILLGLFICMLPAKSQDAKAFFDEGMALFDNKSYEKAIEVFSKAIQADKKYELAYFYRGLCKYYLKKDEQAIPDYTTAIEISPKHDTYYNRGLCYYSLKDYQKALNDFSKSLEIKPTYDKAAYYKGVVLYNQEKYDEAYKFFLRAIANNPEYADAYYYAGLIKYFDKYYDKALDFFNQAVSTGEGKVSNDFMSDYYKSRGYTNYYLKSYEIAVSDLENAMRFSNVHKENPEVHYYKGLAYSYLNNYPETLAATETAILLGSKTTPPAKYLYDYYYLKAWVKLKQKKYEESIEFNTQSIGLKPLAATYYNRGLSYYNLQKYSEAIHDYSEALKLDPKYGNAYYNRGLCYYNLYKDNEALADYTKALDLDPNFINAYYNRAKIKYYDKKYSEAIKDFKKVIELDPNDYEALNYAGLCEYYQKNYKPAIEFYTKATVIKPDFKDAYTNRALAKHEIGDEKGSEADFEKASEIAMGKNQNREDNKNGNADQEIITKSNDLNFDVKGNVVLPKIWALVVGVSKYKTSGINLRYADKDAELFANFLKSPAGGSVPTEQVALLVNETATRANIIKNLKKMAFRAHPDDVFIFYIAGHGQISSSQKGKEVFFLPHDLDPESIDATAISQNDIQLYVAASQAKKKIWIADACHSGGAGLSTGVIRDPQDNITRFLSELAASNDSFVILTASRGKEYSYENEKWGTGHGVFTYHLVEGLNGKADKNANRLIELSELYDYLYDKVANDTNEQQHPELKGSFDNNLPLGVVVK